MMAFKGIWLLVILLPLLSQAQTVQVRQEKAAVEGQSTAGYQVALSGSEEEVKSSLSRYLKALGKTRASGDYITIAEPVIAGRKYSSTLFATTRQVGDATAAWIGVNGEESSLGGDLEKMTYDFGITFHREKIQVQIDESLRALQAVEKQQGRLVNQNKDLNDKIEDNKRDKVELEKALIDNKIELEDLTKNLALNVKAQDSIVVAMEQIKKVVEMHRERQKKVN